jgi:hypothetical protein
MPWGGQVITSGTQAQNFPYIIVEPGTDVVFFKNIFDEKNCEKIGSF